MKPQSAIRLVMAITLVRIPLGLLAGAALVSGLTEQPWIAAVTLGVVVFAMLTDHLDGRFARKYEVVTPLGKVLDPLADMAFFLIIFTAFFVIGWCWLPVLLVFYIREGSMHLFLRPALKRRGRDVGAKWSGKTKTVLQGVVAVAATASPLLEAMADIRVPPLVWALSTALAAAVSVLSLLPYLSALRDGGGSSA